MILAFGSKLLLLVLTRSPFPDKIRHKRSSPRETEKPDIANHSENRFEFIAETQSLSQEDTTFDVPNSSILELL